jgi:hypothetical protein
MKRFFVIATANRGIVKPFESLDDAGQCAANRQLEIDDRVECLPARDRAAELFETENYKNTRGYQLERDPWIPDDLSTYRKPVQRHGVDASRYLARICDVP